jgi:alpha-glucosidase (family GH31 glycosyl hydrolase)
MTDVVEQPVWSTWAFKKSGYNQTDVVNIAHDISDHQYTQSLFILEDGWQAEDGDFAFNRKQFPNPFGMVQAVKALGFNISLWVHPYFGITSKSFQEIVNREIAVRDAGGLAPGLTQWWNGPHRPQDRLAYTRPISGVLDLSDGGKDWLVHQLDKLRTNLSLHCFSFCGGEANSLPYEAVYTSKGSDPADYSQMFSRFAGTYGDHSIVSSAYRAQADIAIIRMAGSSSSFEGLRRIIPQVLTLGLLGYPLVLPDSIGGGGWPSSPSNELFIRWVQLTAFLPIMHFSKLPHNFGPDVVTNTHKYIALHKTLVAPTVLSLLADFPLPIIRPVWWLYNSNTAHKIDSEFLVGNHLLVAPILFEGAVARDVYLPRGKWSDPYSNKTHIGPITLYNYPVDINQIPYFLKV